MLQWKAAKQELRRTLVNLRKLTQEVFNAS